MLSIMYMLLVLVGKPDGPSLRGGHGTRYGAERGHDVAFSIANADEFHNMYTHTSHVHIDAHRLKHIAATVMVASSDRCILCSTEP